MILEDDNILFGDVINQISIEPIIEKIKNKEILTDDEKSILNRHVAIYKFPNNNEFSKFIRWIRDSADTYCDICLNWIDTSEVTSMSYLFRDSRFNGDISKWNTSNVKNMDRMFTGSIFNGDISNWDVSKVTDMSHMFCENIAFNGDISKWNTSNVIRMEGMFCRSTFNGDISNWDVRNVKTMNDMFRNSSFNSDISKWNVRNVTNMERMFKESQFNGDISKWDVYNVEYTQDMFYKSNFTGDISNWYFFKILNHVHNLSDIHIKHSKYNYLSSITKYPDEYDEININGEFILSKILNVDCTNNFSIIENVHKIKEMVYIMEQIIVVMNVKELARLYNIPDIYICHIVEEKKEDINNVEELCTYVYDLLFKSNSECGNFVSIIKEKNEKFINFS